MEEEIQIRTLGDIVEKIPEDKLDFFLEDLKSFVIMMRGINQVGDAINSATGKNIVDLEENTVMHWIDDGQHNKNITISFVEKDK